MSILVPIKHQEKLRFAGVMPHTVDGSGIRLSSIENIPDFTGLYQIPSRKLT